MIWLPETMARSCQGLGNPDGLMIVLPFTGEGSAGVCVMDSAVSVAAGVYPPEMEAVAPGGGLASILGRRKVPLAGVGCGIQKQCGCFSMR